MRKLVTLLGGLICIKIMSQPKNTIPVKTVNNYFIRSGCGGTCGCGKH